MHREAARERTPARFNPRDDIRWQTSTPQRHALERSLFEPTFEGLVCTGSLVTSVFNSRHLIEFFSLSLCRALRLLASMRAYVRPKIRGAHAEWLTDFCVFRCERTA